jgi:uncharacterized protein involved in exopolysaccharide biosynthesis/Mrp family chromosome partitioning ATPase
MNNSKPTQHQPPAGMNVGDIYYVLFRHKWKIIILALAGIAAAAAFHSRNQPPYESQAELYIQYVPESQSETLAGSERRVIMPGSQGAGIINSEIQIMTSFDVAQQAADTIGAASILAKAGGGSNTLSAAGLIRGSLEAYPAGNGSSVISVTFKHPDPQMVQPVLQEVMNDYLQKHNEIHLQFGQYDDAFAKEISAYSVALNDTEGQLRDLKNQANIISIDDTSRNLAEKVSRIQNNILDAQVELAGNFAVMKQAGGAAPAKVETTNAQPVIPPVPPDQIEAYNDICASLAVLHSKEQGYLTQGFTKSNALVQEVDEQMASARKSKAEFEEKYPQITSVGVASPASGGPPAAPNMDAVTTLQAKIKTWAVELDQLQVQSTNLNNLAPTMEKIEQSKAIQKANLANLSEKLEDSHIDQALAISKTPNISWVQKPSPPFQDWQKTNKITAMLAFGGIVVGLAWAFLMELVLDRSVKRPIEIESKLKVPLFLSIPDVNRNGHSRLARAAERRRLSLPNATETAEAKALTGVGDPSPEKNGALQVVSLESNPALQPFYEALRDRLIVYFEVKNLTHKPKLVAVTSAGHGAGVSSIAAGLAASLSETGDGNVLLVDMNVEQGAAQQFYKGKAGCGLDTALKTETQGDALVQANLYVVNGNANSNELPGILPKRFSALVPKLKASNYDYIIFDMPAVTQTSLTSRLARFMDMVLLVVESEKTGIEVVQQANTWLAESGATVGAVLNKTRKYVPERLHQEFLGDK